MSTMTLNPTRELRLGRDLPVAGRQAPGSTGVRLTRRGRVVVVAAILLTVLVAGVFFGSRSVATDEAGTPAPTEVVMVGQGDTLWGIASEIAADGDVPSVMSEIKRLNALDSGMLTLGQKLRIPLAD
ncbi:LysM peptidoglycan-binding domain-containing protein [Nocardioides houyundeii]|uniref:LysM peptidoglycan-binding domain-containing protein n=1 Tax=Nocardioides houyundeii TaxID=2045452 RepID=UPI000DF1B0E6|nr:LysM peptidoglycan-binding domain-containing protein [Nocardioides houyundeii]